MHDGRIWRVRSSVAPSVRDRGAALVRLQRLAPVAAEEDEIEVVADHRRATERRDDDGRDHRDDERKTTARFRNNQSVQHPSTRFLDSTKSMRRRMPARLLAESPRQSRGPYH